MEGKWKRAQFPIDHTFCCKKQSAPLYITPLYANSLMALVALSLTYALVRIHVNCKRTVRVNDFSELSYTFMSTEELVASQ